MSTALGDFLICISDAPGAALPGRVKDPARWPTWRGVPPRLTFVDAGAGISAICSGDVRCVSNGDRGGIGLAREPERAGSNAGPAATADAALKEWIGDRGWRPEKRRGRYVFAFWDKQRRSLTAFTDAFRTYSLFYCSTPTQLLCATDLRLILAALKETPQADRVALYHYLNFAYIPSPRSAVEGVAKLEPGSCLEAQVGKVAARRLWDVPYPEDLGGSDDERARDLRDHIVANVRDYTPGGESQWGTFLSGGTDSSSISGILARSVGDRKVDSFSIGFAEEGYDELSYSRIASQHFGLNAHERSVGEKDTVSIINRLITGFDEPFGNSSAIPTFYCADFARAEGKELLIAGDGGDEIFGGNERYAKDKIFGWYHNAPWPLRAGGSLLARAMSGVDLHIANRVRNMILRGTMPNPDRFYSDDAFASTHFEDLLSPEFRQAVARDDSLQFQRDVYARAGTDSELHRLMYLDLKMTIAESDLVKVIRSANVAGVDVAFPYIDRGLVEYTGRLPDRYKVNGLKKRYLFKLAMEEILPLEIRKKKKQGFGLPIAVWMRREGDLRDLINDVVLSDRARQRGYFNFQFVKDLIDRHERNLWDHAPDIFRLLMLELWHREYLDNHG
jgi:asparagine synthase (glutamine-hydrolysing)